MIQKNIYIIDLINIFININKETKYDYILKLMVKGGYIQLEFMTKHGNQEDFYKEFSG